MRLSLQTDYALRTLLYLAMRPGRSQIHPIAEFYRISKDHVAKVVQILAKKGYVRSIRGSGGGIELAKQPAAITVGEIVREFEGNMNLLECVSVPNVCVIQPSCRLRHVMVEAERLQMEYLDSIPLADMLIAASDLVPLNIEPSNSPPSTGKTNTPP